MKPYLNFTRDATETIEKENFVTGPLTIKPAKNDKNTSAFGQQGWRSGESARLSPMCSGFDSRTRRHK